MPHVKPNPRLRSLSLFALFASGCLCSCDQVAKFAKRAGLTGEKKPSTAAAGHSTPGADSEIPEGILALLPAAIPRIIMVDFYADWCGPCRRLSPILENIAAQNAETIHLCKIDVDKHRELATQMAVRSIPDVRIFVDGKYYSKFVGAPPEAEIRKRFAALVEELPALTPATPTDAADAAQPAAVEPSVKPMPKDWLPPGVQRR